MIGFEELVQSYQIERVELRTWIEQRWVRPQSTPEGNFQFDDVDIARVVLIRELRRDFVMEDESLALVLSLLDQLYAARRMLKDIEEAIQTLPEPIRAALKSRMSLSEQSEENGPPLRPIR